MKRNNIDEQQCYELYDCYLLYKLGKPNEMKQQKTGFGATWVTPRSSLINNRHAVISLH